MVEITCDKCERLFSVDDDRAGTKVSCPLCGDVNRVPADAAAADAPNPGPLPAHDAPEQEICVVRPAMFRAHPLRFLVILILVVGGLVGGIVAFTSAQVWLAWIGIAVMLFGVGWLAKWWVSAYLWIKITITNKRTIRHEGIVRRHSTEVLHDHVRSVDIKQTFIQRLLNTGYIGIDSAGQDDIEIEIRDIPGPYEIKKVIDTYRRM